MKGSGRDDGSQNDYLTIEALKALSLMPQTQKLFNTTQNTTGKSAVRHERPDKTHQFSIK